MPVTAVTSVHHDSIRHLHAHVSARLLHREQKTSQLQTGKISKMHCFEAHQATLVHAICEQKWHAYGLCRRELGNARQPRGRFEAQGMWLAGQCP